MRSRNLVTALLVTGGLLLALMTSLTGSPVRQAVLSTDSIIVVLRPISGNLDRESAARSLLDQFGAQGLIDLHLVEVEGPLPGSSVYVGRLASTANVTEVLSSLTQSAYVLRAERNAPRHFLYVDPITGPLDAEFVNQPYYFDIGVVALWSRGFTGISATHPITVAVIDTGVDLSHPDIAANLVTGFDFVLSNTLPQDQSPDSHGSMVAGIIGAEINNAITNHVALGVAGIGGGDVMSGTPGLRIMPVRVSFDTLDDCAESAQALDYARLHGAQIINMSYGGTMSCTLEYEAIQRAYDAGMALVAGAGNDNSSTPFYPAAYGAGTNDRLVIAVAGVYPSRHKADASNYGAWVDIAAPFSNIWSLTKDGGYASGNGTSYSTPFVSGLIGVLMSNFGWSRDQAVSIVLASADSVDDVNPAYHGLLGMGRINADRASRLINTVYLPLALR
ncbi:MAG TPA: S8 family serine peptidase [Anaerolineae bacterium]|nr:S8 family serine peptidase [Anaerolineae bacterium]